MATKKANEKATETVAEETVQATETVAEPKKPEREKIFIPRGYANDDPNFFVSVNGVNYLLPRGKESEVPAHVAAEIRRARKAQEKLDERRDQMLEAAKQ